MTTTHPELQAEAGLLKEHVRRFEQQFTAHGKLPRDKDWKPIRFAVRDAILGITVIRQQPLDNVLEVDVCITEDSDDDYVGTRVALITLLSEAYKCGSTMGIRFTKNFGHEPREVYPKIYDLAWDLGVKLQHAGDGFISPKESRFLYLALTGFSEAAQRRVIELSLQDLVSPERACYMVHHLTWTLPEMESIILGSEWPDNIMRGDVEPIDYQLYLDAVLRGRAAILGGFLDRKLQLKETVKQGKVVDLEANDRNIGISFDPTLYAKLYTTFEDTPIPWLNQSGGVIPAQKRMAVLVRARDWPDFMSHFEKDMEAMQELIRKYRDGNTYFFLLAPRDVSDIPKKELDGYHRRFDEIGAMFMICPEPIALLDTEAIRRLRESQIMRHDIGTGENRHTKVVPVPVERKFSSTELTWIAITPDFVYGPLSLAELMKQGVYDERELETGVNKANVETRYHLTCDRLHFLANEILSTGDKILSITIPGLLPVFSAVRDLNGELSQSNRLLGSYIPVARLPTQIAAFKRVLTSLQGNTVTLRSLVAFLEKAQSKGLAVLCVQDKYAQQTEVSDIMLTPTASSEIERAFKGQYVPDQINDFAGRSIEDVMRLQVWNAVNAARRGQPNILNMTATPHSVITNTLRYFLYYQPKDFQGPVSVNIVYSDGSKAKPFPLFGLTVRTEQEMATLRRQPAIPVGMLSDRHPEMDSMIMYYWFRNLEVSAGGRVSAQTDELAYTITKEKLAVLRAQQKSIRMAFYQTGFQAPLIGFWRAVTEFLMEGKGKPPLLEIVPYFYDKRADNYEHGKSWN